MQVNSLDKSSPVNSITLPDDSDSSLSSIEDVDSHAEDFKEESKARAPILSRVKKATKAGKIISTASKKNKQADYSAQQSSDKRHRGKCSVDVKGEAIEDGTDDAKKGRSHGVEDKLRPKLLGKFPSVSGARDADEPVNEEEAVQKPKTPKKRPLKDVQETPPKEEVIESDEESPNKTKKHRKTKAVAMPLAIRTSGLRMFLGAHVSSAKGVHNSITNSVQIGGNAFALFLQSQRKWENPPLQEEHRDQFRDLCREHKYDPERHILPHGSYLVNLAQENPERAKQAYDSFLGDLKRCEALGIRLYNFHPGNSGGASRSSALSRIANALNKAHTATTNVKPLLENMAGGGNVIGNTFEDLRDIINEVQDKARIGVCIDTCHAFAAGYDLRSRESFQKTLDQFDKIVGMKYLSALHLNDSKAPFNSHRDLHQNIGLGFLGLQAFHNVMNEPRLEGLPLVLETPIDAKDADGKVIEDKNIWANEIKLLESLIGMDDQDKEFKVMEAELAARGAEERKKYQEAYERKLGKEHKDAERGQKNSGRPPPKRQKTIFESLGRVNKSE